MIELLSDLPILQNLVLKIRAFVWGRIESSNLRRNLRTYGSFWYFQILRPLPLETIIFLFKKTGSALPKKTVIASLEIIVLEDTVVLIFFKLPYFNIVDTR